MTDFQRRVLIAAVGIPVGVGIIFLGDALLAALLGMIAALGAREFFALARAEGSDPMSGIGIGFSAALPVLVHAYRLGVVRVPAAVAILALILLFAAAIWTRGPAGKPIAAISATVTGVAYAGGTITFAYLLRYHPYTIGAGAGTGLLLFPLVLTWTCDTAAYTVGRKLGKRKLLPAVSPGKTVEGAIGGLVATIVVGVLFAKLVLPPLAQLGTSTFAAIWFSAFIAVAAQVGDLAESLLKRSAGVKDSSNLLPGHGGILDRFDSLYFVLPIAYFLLGFILMPAPRA